MLKAGLDDHFAAGRLTVEDLRRERVRFNLEDLSAVRLTRDEKLRAGIACLWRDFRARKYSTRGAYTWTLRGILKALIREGERSGKVVADGLRVVASVRTLAELGGCGQASVLRALDAAEGDILRRDYAGRKADEAGAFVLLTDFTASALAEQDEEIRGAGEEGSQSEGERIPLSLASYTPGAPLVRLPSDAVPELRASGLVPYRERDNRGRLVERREHLSRLGKKRQAVLEVLADAKGQTELVTELADRYGTEGEKLRPWDFKNRTLGPLVNAPREVEITTVEGLDRQAVSRTHATNPGPSVVELLDTPEGLAARLRPDWLEAVQEHRRITRELDAARLQKQDHERQRAAFRRPDRDEYHAEPEMRSIEDKRQSFAFHPEGCACGECTRRFGRLIGEHVKGCACAPCFTTRKEETHRQARRVVPLPSRAAATAKVRPEPERDRPATVARLKPPYPATLAGLKSEPVREHRTGPQLRDGIHHHGPFCDCEWCDSPTPTRYARAYTGSAS